jgi:hypothetical protein
MTECKHGLRSGCSYCHAPAEPASRRATPRAPRSKLTRLSEKMNDRMTALKQRLQQIRGE